MNNDSIHGFKVALIGPPGAGKTTASARIAKSAFNEIHWIEASRDLIESRELDAQKDYQAKRLSGFRYFQKSKELFGPNWAAKRVERTYAKHPNILVSGIRGTENVRHLKSIGYFIIYLDTSNTTCAKRIAEREQIDYATAIASVDLELEQYEFKKMKDISDFILNTTNLSPPEIEAALVNICITVSKKRAIPIKLDCCTNCAQPRKLFSNLIQKDDTEVCEVCNQYARLKSSTSDSIQLNEILDKISKKGHERAALGFSGGKDSTDALLFLNSINARFSTFTVDMGYYPITSMWRAAQIAETNNIKHYWIDGRKHISSEVRDSYEKTATFFDELRATNISNETFFEAYLESRKHYSTTDKSIIPFPRVCVLCRKTVIKTYYAHARQIGAKYIFLGINEWAGLSQTSQGQYRSFSGIRKLAPYGDESAVYIIHLPFIIKSTLTNKAATLINAQWEPPYGEDLVETNSNSCLLAKASEEAFFKATGFHPDATRLSREVSVGFMQRLEALNALSKISVVPWTVRQVLQYANILQ